MEVKVNELAGATGEREATERRLARELEARGEHLETTERALEETTSELLVAQKRIAALEGAADAIGESPRGETAIVI